MSFMAIVEFPNLTVKLEEAFRQHPNLRQRENPYLFPGVPVGEDASGYAIVHAVETSRKFLGATADTIAKGLKSTGEKEYDTTKVLDQLVFYLAKEGFVSAVVLDDSMTRVQAVASDAQRLSDFLRRKKSIGYDPKKVAVTYWIPANEITEPLGLEVTVDDLFLVRPFEGSVVLFNPLRSR